MATCTKSALWNNYGHNIASQYTDFVIAPKGLRRDGVHSGMPRRWRPCFTLRNQSLLHESRVIVYDPDPVRPALCKTRVSGSPYGGGDCAAHPVAGDILHNLVSPAFAWYWQITGNDTYRVQGDELFLHSLDNGPYSGKQFSQAYRWSFDYVNVRTTPAGPF